MIGKVQAASATSVDSLADGEREKPGTPAGQAGFAPVPSYPANSTGATGLRRRAALPSPEGAPAETTSAGGRQADAGNHAEESGRIAGDVLALLRDQPPNGGGEVGVTEPGAADRDRGPVIAGEPAATGAIRRQLEPGRYRLKSEARLRGEAPDYAVLQTLRSDSRVKVLDNEGRTSLFKAGWFLTNEHSWAEAPDKQVGWIDDSQLKFSLADLLEEEFANGAKPPIEQLQKIIDSATPEQRKQAADDQAFLARAKKELDEDTYLGLLPALGVYNKPTTSSLSQGGSKHTSAADADRVIRDGLQRYLVDAIKAGRKVEGEVSVVGDEDFQMAFDRQWVRGAGQSFGGQKAWEVCNAFVDVNLPKRHIWVHRDMGDSGTVIHEGMHKYADATLRDEQIQMCRRLSIPYGGVSRLDEGITEYFTRMVVGQLKMRQRVNYENEFKVASKLAQKYSERTLAQAYYDGKFDALQKAVGGKWADFAEAIEKKDWTWLSTEGFM